MSLEGRINVDALFHDKDGTNAVNVVSLQSSNDFQVGKVVILSGTCSTAATTLTPSSGVGYRDAAGNIVTFTSPSSLAVAGSDVIVETLGIGPGDEAPAVFSSVYSDGRVSATQFPYLAEEIRIRSPNGTSTYTLLIYGT